MRRITINGQRMDIQDGITILQAARQAGIPIPTLCDHPDLTPYGGCRLCVVEVAGENRPVTACTLDARDGMIVQTETEALRENRRDLLKMLLSLYFEEKISNDPSWNELIRWARFYQVPIEDHKARTPRYSINSDPNPFIRVDLNKCIVCTRCIRACNEIQGRFVWGLNQRGYETHIMAGLSQDLLEARCESCGACAAYCPTGALSDKMSYPYQMAEREVDTTCTYCGVGCQVTLQVRNNHIQRVTSSPEAPVNGMRLCVKGRYGYDFIHHPDRLTQPLVRAYLLENRPRPVSRKKEQWMPVDWDTALELTSRTLGMTALSHGPDSIGVLTSAKCTNEENYLMNKLARQVIGTNNIDHCARLCHSSTVAGLAASFGSGAMTNSMDDLAEQAALIFVTGSNTTEQHPVFGTMLRQAVLKRKATLIVADPRRIDLCEFATLHLQMRSGTDIAMLNGLMNLILTNGWEDKEFITARTEGYEDFRSNLSNYPLDKVSKITGIPEEKLNEAARLLGTIKPGAVIWAMGITQHIVGVQNVQTLANLQMLLGNVGKPGSGVNPLRGQNNVQGACDMGGLPNVFPAYQSVITEAARQKFEQAWGVGLNTHLGLTVTEMIPAAESGRIKALFILGEDPVLSDPDTNHVRHCLEKLDFMVLQEIFPTDTAEYADILLPGVSFAEKDGTFTNTERRVQLVRKTITPPGLARQDWQITSEIANRMLRQMQKMVDPMAPFSSWNYKDPTAIMEEINAVAPSYAGVTHARLEKGERLQWPVKDQAHNGTPILHSKEFTRGKGNFSVTQHISPAEQPDATYPILMNTGRVIYHWHGGELTRRARGLAEVYPKALVEINPEDAARMNIQQNSPIRVNSRRGSMQANAWVTDRVPPGMIFSNFHFPESPANALTIAALDPIAKIPEYKITAVSLEAIR